MLTVEVLNDGLHPDDPARGSYRYAVKVNGRVVARGAVADHDRSEGWEALLLQVVDRELEDKARMLSAVADYEARRFRVAVLNVDGVPDSTGDALTPADVSLPAVPVPVTVNFAPNLRVGDATLRFEGAAVVADVVLHAPSTLDTSGLWPAVIGTRRRLDGHLVPSGVFSITGLGLCSSRNVDARIGPLP